MAGMVCHDSHGRILRGASMLDSEVVILGWQLFRFLLVMGWGMVAGLLLGRLWLRNVWTDALMAERAAYKIIIEFQEKMKLMENAGRARPNAERFMDKTMS